MSQNDVILPGSLTLFFNIELTGTNTKHTIASNIVKALVKNLRITLNSDEVQHI